MKFENVAIIKVANVYFEGKVTSRTIHFNNGEKKTLGFMLAGEYEFNTGAEEIMEVLGGAMEVRLKGAEAFTAYEPGTRFTVPANSSFELIIRTYADYCCSYIEA